MRARKITMALAAGALLALPVVSMAKLQGVCSDCHTMHNSQQNQPVALVTGVVGASMTPNPVLLKMDCLSCHAQGGGQKIVTMAGGSQIPQVFHTDPSGDLAGGNFAYVGGLGGITPDDRKGHNVWQLSSADGALTVPPGFSRGPEYGGNGPASGWHTNNWGTVRDPNLPNGNQVTCAGYMGCHGWRNNKLSAYDTAAQTGTTVYRYNLDAITGAHHINDPAGTGVKDPTALMTYDSAGNIINTDHGGIVAASYRFLYGVKGYGNTVDKWQNKDGSSHNEYFGESGLASDIFNTAESCERCHAGGHGSTTTSILKAPNHTMSGFCGSCHSKFHTSAANGTTGFVRHPSDYTIQNKTEYAGYTSYNITAPVARTTLLARASAVVTPGDDMVMCLSCHEAHATNNPGMLRFDYTKMVAGNAAGVDQDTGCFACHRAKDTGGL